MQGIGQFAAGIIALIVAAGFKDALSSAKSVDVCDGICMEAVDKMWRTIIGFGAVPGCIALYYRLTIPETPRYTFDVARDVEKAGADVQAYMEGKHEGHPDEIHRAETLRTANEELETPKASFGDFFRHFSKWRYGKVLLGAAGSWFFLDVAFYGLGLNNTVILTEIGYASGKTMYEFVSQTSPSTCSVSISRPFQSETFGQTDRAFQGVPTDRLKTLRPAGTSYNVVKHEK